MKLILTIKQAPLGSHQMIGKQFSFDERGCSFGRSPENDLVMPDPDRYVSSRHGMVRFDNGVFLIHDQSSNGVFLNNSTVAIGSGRPTVLRNGSSLKAGEYLLEVGIEADELAPDAERAEVGARVPCDARPALKAVPSPSPELPGSEVGETATALDDLALELALRLGLHGMSEEKLRRMPESVTEVVRSCITGIMDVLSSRRQVKHQLKMDITLIQGTRNNALKVSASADEAIERMFTKSGEGYLPPETALLEAFHDISDHQIAMMKATIEVYQKVVERFDPDVLEQRLRGDGKGGGLFSGEPRLWEEYKKNYPNIASGGYPSIHDDFLKEFSTAYTEHLLRLKQDRGRV
jgi:predicted component of type VI protein secretion system